MKVSRKTNPDYVKRKNERPEKGTQQSRVGTFGVQENTEKN